MYPVPMEFFNGDRDSGMTDEFQERALPNSLLTGPSFKSRSHKGSFKLDFRPWEELGEQTLRHGHDPLRDDIANGFFRSHWNGANHPGVGRLHTSYDTAGSESSFQGAEVMHVGSTQHISRSKEVWN